MDDVRGRVLMGGSSWRILRLRFLLLLLAVILVAYIPRLRLMDDVFFGAGTAF
jgi:hypothetical protein